MSSMGAWTYTSVLTVWKAQKNKYDETFFDAPYMIMGSWQQGGELQSDKSGGQFVPASTYYFEAADGSPLIPSPEDFILRGDQTAFAEPPDNAERIKKVGGWDMSPFGVNELPDWVVYT